jgi:RimJ/RimL family protein N-acetyltransferase
LSEVSKILPFVIINKIENKKIGIVGFKWNQNNKLNAEIGIIILSEFQKNRMATESIDMLIPYGFNKLNIRQIISICDINNIKVNNLAKKIGFVMVHDHSVNSSKIKYQLEKQDFCKSNSNK